MSVLIKKLHPSAIVPCRGSSGAAGHDVYSVEDIVVPSHGKAIVSTGIAIKMPHDPPMYCRIAPRSGLAAKNGISIGAGVVDVDYTGEIKVIMFNHSDTDFKVESGDRIAQLVFEKIFIPDTMECVDELPDTERGANGFGSTGK
jgi:dUTP pyrophosphatase